MVIKLAKHVELVFFCFSVSGILQIRLLTYWVVHDWSLVITDFLTSRKTMEAIKLAQAAILNKHSISDLDAATYLQIKQK